MRRIDQVTAVLTGQCGAQVQSVVGGSFVSGQVCTLQQEAADKALELGAWLVGR